MKISDMKYRYESCFLLLFLVLVVSACGHRPSIDDDSTRTSGKIEVVTTTTIFSDFVEQIGGEAVNVRSLVPPQTDIHTFTIGPGDIQAMRSADLLVLGGAGLETSIESAIDSAVTGMKLVLTDGLTLRSITSRHDLHSEHNENEISDDRRQYDPHFWLDVNLVIPAVLAIRNTLTELDPEQERLYYLNTERYLLELQQLDQQITEAFIFLPESRRSLVTFHDAFYYFARHYDLEVLGFIVEGPEEEPSAGEVASLISSMRKQKISFIFTEPQFNSPIVQRVANEAGAEVRILYSGVLDHEITTYIEMMRENMRAIVN